MIDRLKDSLPSALRALLGRMRRRAFSYPQIVTVTALAPGGCRYRVWSDAERGRVVGLGGEGEFLRQFLDCIRGNDVVFDVGACVGLYSLHAALLGARVVAFEPDPTVRRHLRNNVRINRLREVVQIVPWAVSDRHETAALSSEGLFGRSPTLVPIEGRRRVKVVTDSVDRAIAVGEIPVPALVKMDIEGAEILALRGMLATLRRGDGPRMVFAELHPLLLPSFGSSVEACRSLVEDAGYACSASRQRANEVHCVFLRKGAT